MGAGGLQVGRGSEREQLAAVLRGSAAGTPGAVLVSGEPGIGKTDLVREVTMGPAATEHQVLWGRCLRFGADSTPYLPFAQVLTQWHRHADEDERSRVLAGAEHLGTIAPSLGVPSGTADSSRVLPLVATALDRIAQRAPLVLVVDDVQWADGTSLDQLAYLMAGFDAGQRLAVLATYRDTELKEGHRLHGWLADVVRLPSVARMRLQRLGFADTEELVLRLGGGDSSGSVAPEVFERSRGNPYLAELLVRNAAPETGDVALRDALLASWHRLGGDARELLRLLAVGGRPVAVPVLERLLEARGRPVGRVSTWLDEAIREGLVSVRRDEAWFHHPLIGEVVVGTLTPTARRQVHREYVEVLSTGSDLSGSSHAAHLALHHHGAGDADPAFLWSLKAAGEAEAVRGYAEAFDHLHRACLLWEDVSEDVRSASGDRVDLWRRASDSAWSAGEHALSVRLREEAIALAEAQDDPVRTIRLRLPLQHRRRFCGLADRDPGPARAMLDDASARCPETVEHCIALAHVAMEEHWQRDGEAAAFAQAAVEMARRLESVEALAWALAVRSQTRVETSAPLTDAEQALALAREVDDPELLGNAAVWGANCYVSLGRWDRAGDLLEAMFRQLASSGSVHDALWAQPDFAASIMLTLGRWDEARSLLRELLGLRLPRDDAADVRGVASLLAFLCGDVLAGRAHLDRVMELRSRPSRPGDLLGIVEVDIRCAMGASREALSLAAQRIASYVSLDPGGADELLVIAAKAALDLAGSPADRDEAISLLGQVERLRGWDPPRFQQAGPEDLIAPAMGSLFAAARVSCHVEPGEAEHWASAASACSAAHMLWDEAWASYRLARALLSVHGHRREAATALRRAALVATQLGAAPLLEDVDALARQAHISLEGPEPAFDSQPPFRSLAALTRREREVLSHLVVGRTYAEIAQALFISEKTVSVHVSNLLRKTGTSSRIELAELARRGP